MQLLTTKRVIVRIILSFSIVEFMVMLVLNLLKLELNTYLEALLDVMALAGIATPLIYFWVVRPFVMARDEALAEISRLAHMDPLTQLANRRLILQHLEKITARNMRHKLYGAVLLLDLDGFKQINDTHGHEAGDEVLIEIARRIQIVTRAEDVVGRLGGDEFIILLNHLDTDEQRARDKAEIIGKKLIDLVSLPVAHADTSLQAGVSVGIRMLGITPVDVEGVIHDADTAMYRAKQAGKGCVIVWGD